MYHTSWDGKNIVAYENTHTNNFFQARDSGYLQKTLHAETFPCHSFTESTTEVFRVHMQSALEAVLPYIVSNRRLPNVIGMSRHDSYLCCGANE